MKIENKIALAFVALMFIMGMSANTNRRMSWAIRFQAILTR